MSLWVIFTLAAAAMQTVPFMPQKQLKRVGLSTGGATFSRFLFAAPTACLLAALALAAATVLQSVAMGLWLAWREPGEIGHVVTRWRRTVLVGLTGMLGSLGWFAAFSLRNAAYVRALRQVEIVFTLLASALVFRERLALREGFGIVLVVASVVVIVLSFG